MEKLEKLLKAEGILFAVLTSVSAEGNKTKMKGKKLGIIYLQDAEFVGQTGLSQISFTSDEGQLYSEVVLTRIRKICKTTLIESLPCLVINNEILEEWSREQIGEFVNIVNNWVTRIFDKAGGRILSELQRLLVQQKSRINGDANSYQQNIDTYQRRMEENIRALEQEHKKNWLCLLHLNSQIFLTAKTVEKMKTLPYKKWYMEGSYLCGITDWIFMDSARLKKRIKLGQYECRVNFRDQNITIRLHKWNDEYTMGSAANCPGAFHPHIHREESPCWGSIVDTELMMERKEELKASLTPDQFKTEWKRYLESPPRIDFWKFLCQKMGELDIIEVFSYLHNYLSTYNAASPYITLERLVGLSLEVRCSKCGKKGHSEDECDDSRFCEDCGVYIANDDWNEHCDEYHNDN